MKKDYKEILANAKNNSIGIDKKSELVTKVKTITKKTLVLMLLTSTMVSVCACTKDVKKDDLPVEETEYIDILEEYQTAENVNENDYDFDYLTIQGILSNKIMQAKIQLHGAQINYKDSAGNIITNDVETYKKIAELNEDDLIGYYQVLGKDECEKIVIALGYEGWEDFLVKNSYLDKNGNPEIKAWEYTVYENIQKYMEGLNVR